MSRGSFTRVWTVDEMKWIMVPDSILTEDAVKKGLRVTWAKVTYDVIKKDGKFWVKPRRVT